MKRIPTATGAPGPIIKTTVTRPPAPVGRLTHISTPSVPTSDIPFSYDLPAGKVTIVEGPKLKTKTNGVLKQYKENN